MCLHDSDERARPYCRGYRCCLADHLLFLDRDAQRTRFKFRQSSKRPRWKNRVRKRDVSRVNSELFLGTATPMSCSEDIRKVLPHSECYVYVGADTLSASTGNKFCCAWTSLSLLIPRSDLIFSSSSNKVFILRRTVYAGPPGLPHKLDLHRCTYSMVHLVCKAVLIGMSRCSANYICSGSYGSFVEDLTHHHNNSFNKRTWST